MCELSKPVIFPEKAPPFPTTIKPPRRGVMVVPTQYLAPLLHHQMDKWTVQIWQREIPAWFPLRRGWVLLIRVPGARAHGAVASPYSGKPSLFRPPDLRVDGSAAVRSARVLMITKLGFDTYYALGKCDVKIRATCPRNPILNLEFTISMRITLGQDALLSSDHVYQTRAPVCFHVLLWTPWNHC